MTPDLLAVFSAGYWLLQERQLLSKVHEMHRAKRLRLILAFTWQFWALCAVKSVLAEALQLWPVMTWAWWPLLLMAAYGMSAWRANLCEGAAARGFFMLTLLSVFMPARLFNQPQALADALALWAGTLIWGLVLEGLQMRLRWTPAFTPAHLGPAVLLLQAFGALLIWAFCS